jgi:hypothetical protein
MVLIAFAEISSVWPENGPGRAQICAVPQKTVE